MEIPIVLLASIALQELHCAVSVDDQQILQIIFVEIYRKHFEYRLVRIGVDGLSDGCVMIRIRDLRILLRPFEQRVSEVDEEMRTVRQGSLTYVLPVREVGHVLEIARESYSEQRISAIFYGFVSFVGECARLEIDAYSSAIG